MADARNGDIDKRNRLGMALVGGSIAAGVASAILFWRSSAVAVEPAPFTVSAGPTPLGAGVAWGF